MTARMTCTAATVESALSFEKNMKAVTEMMRMVLRLTFIAQSAASSMLWQKLEFS